MNNKELERYKRHILLKEIGGSGQKLLKKSNVTVIGAGGLGSVVLFYLAAAGVGNIKIVDFSLCKQSLKGNMIVHAFGGAFEYTAPEILQVMQS